MGHKLYPDGQHPLRTSIFSRGSNNLFQFAPSAPDATCGCTADEGRYVFMRDWRGQ